MNEEEELFAVYLKSELDKIPVIFRFKEKKSKIVLGSIAIFGALAILVMMIIPQFFTFTTLDINSPTGGNYSTTPITIFPPTLMKILIVLAAVVIILTAWVLIAIQYEKKAFRQASRTAMKTIQYQRQVEYDKWQTRKLKSNF